MLAAVQRVPNCQQLTHALLRVCASLWCRLRAAPPTLTPTCAAATCSTPALWAWMQQTQSCWWAATPDWRRLCSTLACVRVSCSRCSPLSACTVLIVKGRVEQRSRVKARTGMLTAQRAGRTSHHHRCWCCSLVPSSCSCTQPNGAVLLSAAALCSHPRCSQPERRACGGCWRGV
jgi:hypothetical protein